MRFSIIGGTGAGRIFARRLLGTITAACAALGAAPSSADPGTYPSRPITAVVPYSPGSANDMLTRLVAPSLSKNIGQSVVVVNRPGAGGALGTTAIARAQPDGYTIGIAGSATLGVNPHLYDNLSYDAGKDFTPLLRLATAPNVLVVSASSTIKTLDELRAALKTGKLRYNSFGNGTTQHLAGALLAHQANAKADHIPYKNAGEAMTAILSGQVDFGFYALPAVLSQIEAGKLRALGLTTPTPAVPLAGVPLLNDSGFNDFDRTSVWFGMVGPAGIEQPVARRLHESLSTALNDRELNHRLVQAGYVLAPPESPEDFARFMSSQLDFWKELVRVSGAKAGQ